MDENVLDVLKKNPDLHVSGEEIAHALGISRAAVWKHISRLRAFGYVIDAVPHLGYRLVSVPDKMLPDEIRSRLHGGPFGSDIVAYQQTASTNDVAYALAQKGAAEGTVVVAEAQTKGRGRMRRIWDSPEGMGIYASLVLRPALSPSDVGRVTIMSAVSACCTIAAYSGLAAQIKWPNDVFINGKKVCGILTEMNAEQDQVHFVVMGIGINVNTPLRALPPEATSLKAEGGRAFSRVELLSALLMRLESDYRLLTSGKFATITAEWRSRSLTLGKRVSFRTNHGIVEGQAMDIDERGALIVREDSGFLHHCISGDVALCAAEKSKE